MSFVSDGGIEIGGLDEVIGQEIPQGPSSSFDPEACFTDLEVLEQKTALAAIASQVKMYRQVQNHVDALSQLAEDIEIAVANMRHADVKIAVGAYPEEISNLETSLSEGTFELIDAIRAYRDALASKYGIDIA